MMLEYHVIEPQREKTNLLACAPSVDSNLSAQSDQNLHCLHEEICTIGYPKCVSNVRWAQIFEDISCCFGSISCYGELIHFQGKIFCLHGFLTPLPPTPHNPPPPPIV